MPWRWPWVRSLENPNLPLNDPAMWASVFGDYFESSSGESITPRRALEYAPFWQAVTLISSDIGRLGIKLYERTSELGRESRREASEDYRAYLVGRMPNEFFSASQFWARVMLGVLLYGRVAVEIVRRRDRSPSRLLLLNPSQTKVDATEDGTIYVEESRVPAARRLSPADCLLIEWVGWDTLDVLVPFQQSRNITGLGLAQERFASLFFKHGGRAGGILELPAGMPKTARDTVEEGFRKSYESSDAFKTVILRDSAKFHAAQTSPEESQLVEGSCEQVRQVARFFNLPPSKLGLSDATSYNSKSEDNRAYLDCTLARWLKQIEEQLDLKLLNATEQELLFFKFDVSELLRLDRKAHAEASQLYISNKIKNPNEVRLELDLPPYAGGDEFSNPATSSPLAEPASEPEEVPNDA